MAAQVACGPPLSPDSACVWRVWRVSWQAREEVMKMARLMDSPNDTAAMRKQILEFVKKLREMENVLRERMEQLLTHEDTKVRTQAEKLKRDLEKQVNNFASKAKDIERRAKKPLGSANGSANSSMGGGGPGMNPGWMQEPGPSGGGAMAVESGGGGQFHMTRHMDSVGNGAEDGAYISTTQQDKLIEQKLMVIDTERTSMMILEEREVRESDLATDLPHAPPSLSCGLNPH